MICTECCDRNEKIIVQTEAHNLKNDQKNLYKEKFRATITLYPIGRPTRATITLYPIGRSRPVRATVTLYPIGRPTRASIILSK